MSATPPLPRPRWKVWAVHLARVALLATVLGMIHARHQSWLARSRSVALSAIPLSQVQPLFPQAARWGEPHPRDGRTVLDADGTPLGFVIQTTPASDSFLGFSGPSNLLIGWDLQMRIVGVHVLSSRDTRDHVTLIERDPRFLQQWTGMNWDEAARATQIDGVTGATLTSLAMAQGLQKRLGAAETASKFPEPLTIADAVVLFPGAAAIHPDPVGPALWQVTTADGQPLGSILRTSPAADEIVGYQGPTESRIGIGVDGQLTAVSIGASFDNEPYVTYVRDDSYFSGLFQRYRLPELAHLDLAKEGIEGVSGATMTSLAVARSLVQAAADHEQRSAAPATEPPRWGLSLRSTATLGLIALGLLIGLTRLRGWTGLRRVYQGLVIVVLGLLQGELLSLAMFVGWAQSGVPWGTALGLVALSLAAITVPVVAGQNVYCSHLCPHGAVQQWLPRRWRYTGRLPRWLARGLVSIRPLLLLWVVFVAVTQAPFNLVDIEPFDAYAWRAAAWPTVIVAVVGLVASLFVPMAYCRFGCPTGAVLDYVRRHSQSDRLTRADLLAGGCLVLGGLLGQLDADGPAVAAPAAAESTALDSPQRISGRTMGTTWSVLLPREGEHDAVACRDVVQLELDRLEAIFSLYQTDSELSRLNRAATSEWIPVTADLARVAAFAIDLSRRTEGAFDPTIGPLTLAWKLRTLNPGPPAEAELARARSLVGVATWEVRLSPPAIRKQLAGSELDLNAVVEGYALDQLTKRLQSIGITDALLELGGEYRGLGTAAPGRPWQVGIESAMTVGQIVQTVPLADRAISTSATSRQRSHLLDPRTGQPVSHTLRSVSVIAPSALEADGWATALMILGPTEGRQIASRERLHAVFQEMPAPPE